MSAPGLWIFFPLLIAGITLVISNERFSTLMGGLTSLVLAITALLIPIDTALLVGSVSIKISSTFQVLGRSLSLDPADGSLLAILYGIAALWFFGAEAAGVGRRLVPLGMGIIALLVASIAVQPFLFAATFIEIAVLLAIPLLSPPGQPPGRGVVRFLVYQTLAMPFILFAGWMLAGVEASPGDLALTVQSAIMLGLGFAFLLAVFPLYSWMPQIGEEALPFVSGFLFWALPTITMIFGMGFLDRYTWLRTSPAFTTAMQVSGILMVVSGGLWSAFQRHLGRIMAYAAVMETGYQLMALTVQPSLSAVEIIFLHIIPRGLSMAVWAFSLNIIVQKTGSLRFGAVQGLIRAFPLASTGVVLANLSAAGFPLLAGFPPRAALWQGLASQSLPLAFWLLLGVVGLIFGALRSLAVLVMAPEHSGWTWNETSLQGILIVIGMLGLFFLGLFPQALRPFLVNLPGMFTHLIQ